MTSSNLELPNKDLNDVYLSSCNETFTQILADHSLIQPLRRLIIIGRLKYADRDVVKYVHEQVLNKIQNDIKDVALRISGLLVIHETFFYHIVESSDKTLGDVIKATSQFVQEMSISGAKVIRTCSIVNRYFNNWNSCVIITPNYKESTKVIKRPQEESIVLNIAKMIKKLEDAIFVLASFVRFLKAEEFDEKMNELVPIGVLLFKEELEDLYKELFFLTVEDYINRYYRMPEYISFVEKEWPPTGIVQDANEFFEELDRFEKQIDVRLQSEEEQKKKKKPGYFWWTVKAPAK